MDDLISRQAAIRFIRDKVSLSLFMKRSVDKADKACVELCDMLDRELPSAQQWIPVTERLPEKGQTCLVCDEGVIAIDKYLGIGNPLNWDWYDRDYEAWMPLPEPYKEGEQDG